MARHATIALGIGLLVLGGPGWSPGPACHAGGVPPLDFIPIGNPGNRDTIPAEVPLGAHLQIGGVDHEFQITRSPLTVEQWFEFVNAY